MTSHCLPFSQIPHTTPLLTDFLEYSPKVRQFYPRSPFLSDWLRDEAERMKYDSARRERVTGILERQNRSFDASARTLENIERFRRGAGTVVTGQQVGLFGGPAFSLYKALTAVKLAEEATAAGVAAVPVFWLATYDHDLAEVNHVSIPGPDGALEVLAVSSQNVPGAPVSAVRFGDEINPVVERAAELLGDCEAIQFLRECYRPGETLGTAFARLFAKTFAAFGVIVMDPSDPEFSRIAEPIYVSAIERAGELDAALLARGRELESAGYHQQVKVTESSVLLFTTKGGARTPMSRREDRTFVVDGAGDEKLSAEDLISNIHATPERYSPNVLLRPIVQDYLLPTLVYTGGAAETAYFAQAGAVYELLLGRVTPILPRFSATIIEAKVQRLMEKYGLSMTDIFSGPESLKQVLAAKHLPSDLLEAFDVAKKSFDSNLGRVKEKLEKLDRTLVDAAETAQSKMQHQLEKLYAQAARAEAQKQEIISRHADLLNESLYPEKGLQERSFGGIYFLARYGQDFLRELHATMKPDCHDHQIVEL